MAQIVIDADALDRVAAQLQVPASTVKTAVNRFNATITSIGEPWGDGTDEISKEWAKIYIPGLANAQHAFDEIVAGLLGLSKQFADMAERYRRVEGVNSN